MPWASAHSRTSVCPPCCPAPCVRMTGSAPSARVPITGWRHRHRMASSAKRGACPAFQRAAWRPSLAGLRSRIYMTWPSDHADLIRSRAVQATRSGASGARCTQVTIVSHGARLKGVIAWTRIFALTCRSSSSTRLPSTLDYLRLLSGPGQGARLGRRRWCTGCGQRRRGPRRYHSLAWSRRICSEDSGSCVCPPRDCGSQLRAFGSSSPMNTPWPPAGSRRTGSALAGRYGGLS